MINIKKTRWNDDLESWVDERHYTKDEIDKKLLEISPMGASSVTVTVTYTDGSSQTVDLFRRV